MADASQMSDAHPDMIGVGSSTALLGAVFEYQYSTGNHYKLIFDDDFHVTFEMLGSRVGDRMLPGEDAPSLSYRSKEIRPGLILIQWIVKDADIHVTIVFDLTARTLHVGAMMPPNKYEFWDSAEILEMKLGNQ